MIKEYSRVEYERFTLSAHDIAPNPVLQLERWWLDAISQEVNLLDAVHLSTVDQYGHPDARIVLLKHFDAHGLVFYTNYESKKAMQLAANPHACIIIFWPKLERQVRVRGVAKKISRVESESYFASRPKGAQIGAWASPQSKTINCRSDLEKKYLELSEEFGEKTIPCPKFWGGYRLVPNYFEFWQGRSNRLHDRFSFHLNKSKWIIKRLAP